MNNPLKLPVQPVKPPILVALNRWLLIRDEHKNIQYLQKEYLFTNIEKFSMFIHDIVDYQTQTNHFAELQTTYDTTVKNSYVVSINVWTRTINQVTNIDKEFARYCDIVFKDLMSND